MPKEKNCHFKDEWTRNNKYSEWIKPTKNSKKAKCVWCRTEINIANMGVSALDSHASGRKHMQHARTSSSADIFFSG